MNLEELYKLAYDRWDITNVAIGPATLDKDLMTIRVYCAFEAFSYESFDLVWEISLPQCHRYVPCPESKGSWRKVNDKLGLMVFKGKSLEDAIKKCSTFLETCPKDEERSKVKNYLRGM